MSGTPPPLYKPELIEPKTRLTLLQHCYMEPWIPAGCLATVGALCYGFVGFIQKDSKMMQNGMRGRVVAQFLTVATMLAASTSMIMKGRGGADAQSGDSKGS